MSTNPYDPDKSYKQFVGHKQLIEDILNEVNHGQSIGIFGGSKIGKTSILNKLRDEIRQQKGLSYKPYAFVIPMDLIKPASEETIYHKIIELLSEEIGLRIPNFKYHFLFKHKNSSDPIEAYDTFKNSINSIIKKTNKKLNTYEFKIIIMIDKIGHVREYLPTNTNFYSCLREFFMNSYDSFFQLVFTSGRECEDLIVDASPLNFVKKKILEVLNIDDALELINIGFSSKNDAFKNEIIRLTGGHPYLMQGIMGELFRSPRESIKVATERFINEKFVELTFKKWMKTFSETQKALYFKLINNRDDYLKNTDLEVLKYHGVISYSTPYFEESPIYTPHNENENAIKISGDIFKNWFLNIYVPEIKINQSSKKITKIEESVKKYREGRLKQLKIFIGSSDELRKERSLLKSYIQDKNDALIEKNYYMKPVMFEKDVIQSITEVPFQKKINSELEKCHIAFFLFWKKVGQYTEEELNLSLENCKQKKNPKNILVFFKEKINGNTIGESFKKIIDLKEKFKKNEVLIYLTFHSDEELKNKLDAQLNLIIKDRENIVNE